MDKSTLTRTCSSCGLKKPLAAFLQISPKQGTIYGSICSTCRSNLARATHTEVEEEWSKAGSTARIGAKEKAFLDEQKHRELLEKQDEKKKEQLKRDEKLSEKALRDEQKQKYEKDHRSFFLDSKKLTATEKFTKAETNTQPEAVNEIKILHEILTNEQKFRSGEIGNAPLALNQLRYNTAMFMQFVEAFLNESSPLKRFLQMHSKKPAAFGSKSLTQEINKAAVQAVEEHIERNFGPGARKGG